MLSLLVSLSFSLISLILLFTLSFSHLRSVQIRELVVHCLSQMIRARASNIQSGWKSILFAFTAAASDESEIIASLTFEMVDAVTTRYFHLISESFFVDLVQCLAAHAKSSVVKELSIKSVKLLGVCADHLAKGDVIKLEGKGMELKSEEAEEEAEGREGREGREGKSEVVVFTDQNEKHIRLWFPIFTSLSQTCGHSHLNVRAAAVKQLFSILRSYGRMFSDNMWRMIFRGTKKEA